MKQLLLLIFLLLLLFVRAEAQVDCNNIGFEQGNSNGWTLTYGTVTDQNQKTVYGAESNGTLNNDHYVTSLSDGNDPKISAIPMVAPGSTHSIRIGNTVEGSHFSRIRANYLVTSDNTLFQYKFAVILQNTDGTGGGNGGANHEPYQKPGFNILIYDSNGDELPCSSYDIQLEGNNTVDGFTTSGDIQYRNWTTGAIDLRNYVGKSINIVVTAHGCTRMRHFGYAYFDAECLKSEIKIASSCPDSDGNLTLMAPEGFGQYAWSNGETTQNIKVKAALGAQYSVQLVPLGSLDVTCALKLDYTIEYKKATASINRTICEGEEVAVGDTVYRTSGTFIKVVNQSNVCDSTVTLKLTVNPVARYSQDITICAGESLTVGDTVYTTSGTYTKVIPQNTGCDSTVITNLNVLELDIAVTSNFTITQGDSAQIQVLAEPQGNYIYLWEKENSVTCPNCAQTWTKPDKSTQYNITVSDADLVCSRKGSVYISVKPCGITVPDAFSPNNDQYNEVFFVYGNSCVKQIREMMIYNRWGEVIYEQSNFAASDPAFGWPGTYHGVVSSAGVYPYKIQVELKDGDIQNYEGVVNLLR
ncbi:gliding motility-associated C-terminal domain-containing protein [Dyadobacter sp. NIV53]|uniref:T9SS type B sorting domain-containing protein n=1 Tax=Dyadobacter sp. NIV53 TaxID=2861765 RepID=UPI001C8792EA|nr:gliding motility-associated C-terminal domain-containing protein [Dyadobacter sp. NIV53]